MAITTLGPLMGGNRFADIVAGCVNELHIQPVLRLITVPVVGFKSFAIGTRTTPFTRVWSGDSASTKRVPNRMASHLLEFVSLPVLALLLRSVFLHLWAAAVGAVSRSVLVLIGLVVLTLSLLTMGRVPESLLSLPCRLLSVFTFGHPVRVNTGAASSTVRVVPVSAGSVPRKGFDVLSFATVWALTMFADAGIHVNLRYNVSITNDTTRRVGS